RADRAPFAVRGLELGALSKATGPADHAKVGGFGVRMARLPSRDVPDGLAGWSRCVASGCGRCGGDVLLSTSASALRCRVDRRRWAFGLLGPSATPGRGCRRSFQFAGV